MYLPFFELLLLLVVILNVLHIIDFFVPVKLFTFVTFLSIFFNSFSLVSWILFFSLNFSRSQPVFGIDLELFWLTGFNSGRTLFFDSDSSRFKPIFERNLSTIHTFYTANTNSRKTMPHTHSTTHNKLNFRESASKPASKKNNNSYLILFYFFIFVSLLVGERRFFLFFLFQTVSQVCKTLTLLLDSLFWCFFFSRLNRFLIMTCLKKIIWWKIFIYGTFNCYEPTVLLKTLTDLVENKWIIHFARGLKLVFTKKMTKKKRANQLHTRNTNIQI